MDMIVTLLGPKEEKDELMYIFNYLDKDENGIIDAREL